MAAAVTLAQFLSVPINSTESRDDVGAATGQQAGGSVFGAWSVAAHRFASLRYRAPSDYRLREVRGDRMRTVGAAFDEFAAALQFPYYFGHNRDAFDDCLGDLDDFLGPAAGYVVAVRDADDLLGDTPNERAWLTEALTDCAQDWSDRGVVFRVVLQGEPSGLPTVTLSC